MRAIGVGVLVASLAACGGKSARPPDTALPAPLPMDGGASATGGDAGAPKVAEADWQLLVDLDALPAAPAITKPEAIAKLVGTTYKTLRKAKKDCTGKGDAVLVVDGAYEGAFTKKEAKEMLYLVNLVPCDDKTPATHNLLVLQGNKAVVNEKVQEHDIVEVKDLDQDGDNEILLIGGWPPQVKARLVDTEDGKFETLFDFGEIARGACDGGSATGESAVIKYRKSGASMEYKAEKKPRSCSGGGR